VAAEERKKERKEGRKGVREGGLRTKKVGN
jgi:hypothetical protein